MLEVPVLRGGLLALLASALFGISTPLVQSFGVGLGPLSTAALLYAGAALVGALLRQPAHKEAALHRTDLPRLLAMAFFGAMLGPVLLAWGLQRTSGTSASLMLSLEAVFTAVLAWYLYYETMDKRVWAAMALLLSGGVALIVDQGQLGSLELVGLLAVLLATAAWGVDNSLSRGLADKDPGAVVLGKAALGTISTTTLAWLASEPLPQPGCCPSAAGHWCYRLRAEFAVLLAGAAYVWRCANRVGILICTIYRGCRSHCSGRAQRRPVYGAGRTADGGWRGAAPGRIARPYTPARGAGPYPRTYP